MAFDFQRNSPVHNFRPRAHVPFDKRQHLLWPAWRYQVVAPEPRDKVLNVFQKAVLGMCRIGIVNREKVGGRLHLHPDLVAKIMLELQMKALVDSHGIPTQKGLDLLAHETIEDHKTVVGYVFQDPWSGQLWPRFVEQSKLDSVNLQYGEKGFPILVLGTKGKPYLQPTYMHLPKALGPPQTPEAAEIVTVTRRHNRAARYSDADENMRGENDGEEDSTPISSSCLDRVSMVEDKPTPCFLNTYIYLPQAEMDVWDWYACDPFGLGVSARLKKRIEEQLPDYPGLRTTLDRLVGEKNRDRLEDQRKWHREIEVDARAKAISRLGATLEQLPFFEVVVEMECCRQEVELLDESCPKHKFRDTLNAARRVLEGVFGHMLAMFPDEQVWRALYKDEKNWQHAEYVKKVYNSSASSMGFVTPLPASLAVAKPSDIKAVSSSGKVWKLRAAIVVSMLSAARVDSHPLRSAAKRCPDLLERLASITDVVNDAAHFGQSGQLTTSRAKIQVGVDSVYQIIRDIYELPLTQ
ncbi:MAG: hypothetical protein FDZ69_04580 [Deltaproteobacteria bacterium]|nr:MAG: hypothetical protein FDZ69_04580 [Deltaproteobacteria bacterium]